MQAHVWPRGRMLPRSCGPPSRALSGPVVQPPSATASLRREAPRCSCVGRRPAPSRGRPRLDVIIPARTRRDGNPDAGAVTGGSAFHVYRRRTRLDHGRAPEAGQPKAQIGQRHSLGGRRRLWRVSLAKASFPFLGAHPTRETQRRLSTTLFPSMGIIRVMCPSWRDTVRRLGTLLIHRRNRFLSVRQSRQAHGPKASPHAPSVGQDKNPYILIVCPSCLGRLVRDFGPVQRTVGRDAPCPLYRLTFSLWS